MDPIGRGRQPRRLYSIPIMRQSLALILFTTLPAAAQTPKVFWQSAPVQPNDTVMVAGEDMQDVTAVRVARVTDSAPR